MVEGGGLIVNVVEFLGFGDGGGEFVGEDAGSGGEARDLDFGELRGEGGGGGGGVDGDFDAGGAGVDGEDNFGGHGWGGGREQETGAVECKEINQ